MTSGASADSQPTPSKSHKPRRFGGLMELAEYLRGRREESYGLALLIFGAAVVLRVVLDAVIADRLPFITFFPAVLLATYLCGLWPGSMILVLSAFTGAFWSVGDTVVFRSVGLALFLAIAGINVALVHYLQSAFARLRAQDRQLALINEELKHRIKNLFSITNAICQQSIRSGAPVEEMSRAVSGRIQAIAAAQDLLSVTATRGADLAELVAVLVHSLAPEPSRLRIDGGSVLLPAEATTPFALVLHELGTNAIKYGAWSVERGYVAVSWSVAGGELAFRWREHGELSIAPPLREGFGTKLIKDGLAGASVQHDVKADGLECLIRMSLAA